MKILVTIISSEKHLDSRIKIIQDTWLKDFENYLHSHENIKYTKVTTLANHF
jgi:hypothetical protein